MTKIKAKKAAISEADIDKTKDVYVVVPRPFGDVQIMIMTEGSEEYEAMTSDLEENGYGFQVTKNVIRCLGPVEESVEARP